MALALLWGVGCAKESPPVGGLRVSNTMVVLLESAIRFSATVTNTGEGETADGRVTFYTSSEPAIDGGPSDTMIGEVVSLGRLAGSGGEKLYALMPRPQPLGSIIMALA